MYRLSIIVQTKGTNIKWELVKFSTCVRDWYVGGGGGGKGWGILKKTGICYKCSENFVL